MPSRRRPTLAAIQANPTIHSRAFAVVQERFAAANARRPDFKWHLHADSPNSSQAFALSAFLPLLEFPDKDEILDAFVTQALSMIPSRADRSWDVLPEYSDPRLLWESGRGERTAIDLLLVADDVVVCVECKFRADARQGWGACSQPQRLCGGFHGPGSDRKGTAAWCRLEVPDGDRGPRILVATGRYLGEGFDDSRLDTLFLALPISWRGTLAQYAGRLHRLAEGKTEVVIYDYADLRVPMLARMHERRLRGYRAMGYEVD